MEQRNEWTESRRSMGLEVLAKVEKLPTQDMGATAKPVGSTPKLEHLVACQPLKDYDAYCD